MYIFNTIKQKESTVSVHKVYLLVGGMIVSLVSLFVFWQVSLILFIGLMLYIYETTPRIANGFYAFSSTIDAEERRLLVESYFSEEVSFNLRGIKAVWIIRKTLTGLLRKKTDFYEIYLVDPNDKLIATKMEFSTLKKCLEVTKIVTDILHVKLEKYIETSELYSRKKNNHFYLTLFQKNSIFYDEIKKIITVTKVLNKGKEEKSNTANPNPETKIEKA